MEPMNWTPIEGRDFWNPKNPGEQIVGEIKEITQGTYGTRYVLTTDKGDIALPSHKVLQGRLQGCVVGDWVRCTYKGEQAPKVRGENPTKLYECDKGTPIVEEKVGGKK